MQRGLATLVVVGACLSAGSVEAKPYKGAEVYTQMQYKFGRIEVRMRSASGGGILSTFFTYKQGSEAAGALWEEIDVEVMGKSNAAAFQSNILVGNPRMGSEQIHPGPSSLAGGYHTYTIEWTPTSVVWLLDGVETRRTTGGQANQLTSAHNFRFNLWASNVSSWAGAFETAALPQYQYVNWIRYYRYEGGAFVLDWSDDFNTFDTTRWSKADWSFDGNLADFAPSNAVARDGTLVLCLAAEGQACTGAVPMDSAGNGGSGGGGLGGASSGGASPGGAGGASSGGGGAGGSSGGAGGSSGGAGGSSGGAGGSSGGAGGLGTSGGASAGGNTATGGASAAAGAAGSLGTAGTPTGTSGASSGSPGTGGAGANTGTATGGSAVVTPTGPTESGCAFTGTTSQSWLGLAVGLGLAARRRRNRKVAA